ncbi:hypothetical protein BBG47_22935 [Paenibacillus sp. KS1]|uniref:hypothetical protein n=1 Tax=Paenibacillus sp. KS1 TaxID=1849249 RepID=UPI00080658A0|nr:hypothetical protein [Paenibacillus sp. KS1]OBY77191.1 hypothetical protein BBG47_22935 [Paenibacillus sp. KS1]
MKQAVIELVLDLGYEIVYLNGYLIAEDYLVVIEHGIMWLYHVRQKDDGGFYVSNKAGIWLGKLKGKEAADEPELIARVINYMRDMSFYDFLIKHHDWTVDYDFHFVEAVS